MGGSSSSYEGPVDVGQVPLASRQYSQEALLRSPGRPGSGRSTSSAASGAVSSRSAPPGATAASAAGQLRGAGGGDLEAFRSHPDAGDQQYRTMLWGLLIIGVIALLGILLHRVSVEAAAPPPAPQAAVGSTAAPMAPLQPGWIAPQTSAAPSLPPGVTVITTTVTATTTTVTTTTTTYPRPVCPATAKRFGPMQQALQASPTGKRELSEPGCYDLRILKGNKVVGCAAPVNLFPGNQKYGCAGPFGTAVTCDAAPHPVRHTAYVWSVHDGCQTMNGKGTYGYAYDDGVGLKQCAPVTRYDWVLCPAGDEASPTWEATAGGVEDTLKRFRVVNKCQYPIWIDQAGSPEARIAHEPKTLRLEPSDSHTYAIPNRGLASTRFIPKTGCDASGDNCDIQSMPPCPPQGCDAPVDTKFEASWGCVYAKGKPLLDKRYCALTGQGQPATYQDWWDGSAVDGWTLPFSVLVEDSGRGLTADSVGSPSICGDVVCAKLDMAYYCPQDEFLTP